MRVGIDVRAGTEDAGGKGRYVRELIGALAALDSAHQLRLYARERWEDAPNVADVEWHLLEHRGLGWHRATAAAANAECDAFLSTSSYLTSQFLRIPTVVVVHDLIAFHRRHRPQRRAAMIEHATLRRAARRAAAVLADSESTRKDLAHHMPGTAAKTTVVPLAAGAEFSPTPDIDDEEILRRLGLQRPYVLALGTLEPRKNLPRLITAFAGLDPALRGDRELVLAGATGWSAERTLTAVSAHSGAVRMLGHVAGADLPALFRRAEVFCYPSLYEGFGLPILEAMQAGAPVITSRVSSMPEVGGECARYVNPLDIEDIGRALSDVLNDPAATARMKTCGLRRAQRFSWARTAHETARVIEAAV